MFYRARLIGGEFSAGDESLACELYGEAEVPWDELSFPVVTETLRHYFHDRQHAAFPVHHNNIIIKRRAR